MSKRDFYTEKYITVVGMLKPDEYDIVCSEHKTASAAQKAAARCEKKGGLTHTVWRVERVA